MPNSKPNLINNKLCKPENVIVQLVGSSLLSPDERLSFAPIQCVINSPQTIFTYCVKNDLTQT